MKFVDDDDDDTPQTVRTNQYQYRPTQLAGLYNTSKSYFLPRVTLILCMTVYNELSNV